MKKNVGFSDIIRMYLKNLQGSAKNRKIWLKISYFKQDDLENSTKLVILDNSEFSSKPE